MRCCVQRSRSEPCRERVATYEKRMARPAGRAEFRTGVGWLKRDSIPRTEWFLLACVCAFFYFYGLGFFGLIGADEPRYAQVAREMLARHDWITPALNGKAWLEKPVLYYWQAMLAYSIFGVSDWAARLPGAVDASGLVLAVYLFLQRFRKGSELDGAMMTASAAAIVGFA